MTNPSPNLPKLFLRPDWMSSNTNLVWIGIGLALVSLNADVVSAAVSDHEKSIHLDDIESILLKHDLENSLENDESQYLQAFQSSPNDERSILLAVAQLSDSQTISGEAEDGFPNTTEHLGEQERADQETSYLSGLQSASDEDSAVVPLSTANLQARVGRPSTVGLAQSQLSDLSGGVQEDNHTVGNTVGQSVNRPTELVVSVLPAHDTYQSVDRFVFQPPVEIELLTPESLAYGQSNALHPSGMQPLISSGELGGNTIALNTVSSPSLVNHAPFAGMHLSLPMASLGQSSPSAEQHELSVLIPVPAVPPVGHGQPQSNTLPLPPSLPSLTNDWPASQPLVNHSLFHVGSGVDVSNRYASSTLLPSPYPLSSGVDLASVDRARFSQNSTPIVASSLPQPYAPHNIAASSTLPIEGQWTHPTPIPVASPIAVIPYSPSRPAAFNPSAPFAAMAVPQQSSLEQFAAPSPWNSGLNSLAASPVQTSSSAATRQTLTNESLATSARHLPSAPRSYNPAAAYASVAPATPSQSAAASPFAPPAAFNPLIHDASSLRREPSNLLGQVQVPPGLPTLSPINPRPDGGQVAPFSSSQAPGTSISPSTNLANAQQGLLTGRTPITPSTLQLQGAGILVDDDFSARARLSGSYYLTPQILIGTALDITEGESFSDSETEGFNINELYLAAALRDLPNLRFVIGQIDLTSYFDRNSFAKDSLTHFFNPTFQTNPALAANAIGSRPGVLVNFSPTDTIDARVAAFSSDRSIGEFDLDGFAGELGFQVGNLILRGTYVSARDGGTNDGPAEIFSFARSDGDFGIREGDREESFGFNAEFFVPEVNIGFFGRYGRYENLDADFSGDTFSGGFNVLDVFTSNDRLGLAYGRTLSNDSERTDETPDVLELFYDVPLFANPNTRLGVTLQQRDEFSETVAGIRFRTTFDILR